MVGSLAILAWVDWRLLAGALLLLPVKFFTHRTWIGRIRPLYRDIRIQRQDIDGSATETFAGMRVVRAFGRQRSEAGRFRATTHFMARQTALRLVVVAERRRLVGNPDPVVPGGAAFVRWLAGARRQAAR